LLAEYPTPQSLAQLELSELASFLEKVSKGHLGGRRVCKPVSDDSGKRKGYHKTTHRVNKVAKDAIMQIAECNRRVCEKSKKYYQKKYKSTLAFSKMLNHERDRRYITDIIS